MEGSSPRVRGKPPLEEDAPVGGGLIPARAGKTRRGGGAGCSLRAHPRACGENWERAPGGVWERGSSPRVRGKLGAPHRRKRLFGLIPARAGKTSAGVVAMRVSGAHPRACGENGRPIIHSANAAGSSPRVRGKPTRVRVESLVLRLIPARAGKTTDRRPSWLLPRAHPRACGENTS